MPKVSVIVPVYKVEPYLHRCIDSILDQTFTDFELILVDDGSPDNCGAICDEYAEKDPRVRVIHKENGGVSSARNAGLDAAQGEYVSFLDGDDWLHFCTLGLMVRASQEYDVCGVTVDYLWIRDKIVSEEEINYEDIELSVCNIEDIRKSIYYSFHSPTMDNVLTCGLMGMYRSSYFAQVRFDEQISYAEDLDVQYRLNLETKRVLHMNTKLYYYYLGNSSATRSNLNQSQMTVLAAYLKVGDIVSQIDRKEAAKMYYRYIYKFFDMDVRVRTLGKDELIRGFAKYRMVFCKRIAEMLRNPYLSFLEKMMILLYYWNCDIYRLLFGKCEVHMLSLLESFRNKNGEK